MVNIDKHYLVKFHREKGTIGIILEGLGTATLRGWALLNCAEKTSDIIIFRADDGEVIWYYEGTGDFPKITFYQDEELGNIDDYCPELLETLKEEE